MGRSLGFLSGVTLTTLTLYLPLKTHESIRTQQGLLLRRSRQDLLNLLPTTPVSPEVQRARRGYYDEPIPDFRNGLDGDSVSDRPGLVDLAKEKWNAELENNIRKVWSIDWTEVAEDVATSASVLFGKIRKSVAEASK